MARVLKTYPGQDGLVRVALLKTARTTLKHPVAKLAVLLSEPVRCPTIKFYHLNDAPSMTRYSLKPFSSPSV
jgi:hypothetical protein